MVFCGKASLSCKNCRIRRIKCNKLEPECSQCIRAGKKCPGYRDQLSLMFRDETVKVRKKFEESNADSSAATASSSSVATSTAASGTPAIPTTAEPPSSDADNAGNSAGQFSAFQITARGPPLGASAGKEHQEAETTIGQDGERTLSLSEALAAFGGTLDSDGSVSNKDSRLSLARKQQRRQGLATSPTSDDSTSPEPYVDLSIEAQTAVVTSILNGPGRTLPERGLQFYMEHYLYGHPESPKKSGVMAVDTPWILDPAARTIAAAVGMAGIANLRGDDQIQLSAWQNYVTGLQMTAKALARPGLDGIDNVMRSIVLMAMFEIVRGANQSFGSANVHVMGMAALLRRFLPMFPTSLHPYRGLVQICYSLLISCHAANIAVPPVIVEYVSSTYRAKPEDDQIMTKLLLMLADCINFSAYVHHQVLTDGRSDMVQIVVQALQLEARLIAWEHSVIDKDVWKFEVCETSSLPPEACYKGRFHRYSDIPTARIWGYQRWVRILLNTILLDFIKKCPLSVAAGLAELKVDKKGARTKSSIVLAKGSDSDTADANADPTEKLRRKALRTIRTCAEATFMSTPVYWRHPSISLEEYATVASPVPIYGANGGTGVAGLMPTLFHLHVAACAPGVPDEDWKWALGVIETVWAYLGLRQARTLADKMWIHHDAVQRQRMSVGGVLLLTVNEETINAT